MQIAIDGPAGAGKSTVAKEVAAQLGFKYLDTGAMYRALGTALSDRGIQTTDRKAVLAALPSLQMEISYDDSGRQRVIVNGTDMSERIRTAEAAKNASDVAIIPEVRHMLVELQRQTAAHFNVVMDGRDIGSYVLPHADFKFYVTASARARAERRCEEMRQLGESAAVDEIEAEIKARDAQDMNRQYAPLALQADQVVVDTTDLSQQQAAEALLTMIRGQA